LELVLSGNRLTGTIPAELYDAKRLEVRLQYYPFLERYYPFAFG